MSSNHSTSMQSSVYVIVRTHLRGFIGNTRILHNAEAKPRYYLILLSVFQINSREAGSNWLVPRRKASARSPL